MKSIQKRVVLHFPGFEPLHAAQHRDRFVRAAKLTSAAWNVEITCSALRSTGGAPSFQTEASGPNWQTVSQIHILDISNHIAELNKRPFLTRLVTGYSAFFKVIVWGGLWQYFRHAWRFGCFFLFPFIVMTIGLLTAAWIALSPIQFGISSLALFASLPLAMALYWYVFLPFADRFYTTLLFSDWKCAVDFATLTDQGLNARIEEMALAARDTLRLEADEYVISSHSIGGQSAVHVIGILLEREPKLFENKKIIFATIGSGLLQSALLSPAKQLRERVAAIAEHLSIFWFDVQSHTDIVNFYKTKIANAAGYKGTRQPEVSTVRMRTLLAPSRYRRIKRDLMRIHRQYVMGNDVRANFDFPLMCSGPLPAASFANIPIGSFPPIDDFGALQLKSNVAGFTV